MYLITFLLLSYLSRATAWIDYRRCLLHRGQCVSYCPRKMHAYHTRCNGETMTQKTCDSPEASLLGYTCGWSRCDCNGDLVYDEKSGFCVTLEFCELNRFPDNVRRKYGDRDKEDHRRTKLRPSKKIKIPEDDSVAHLPYTGHCPLLKFRYGKCYGDNTRQILREIRSKGLFNKPLEYRPRDNYELENMPQHAATRDVYDGLKYRKPTYMTGYTGFVPGMNFAHGKSYGRTADDCMADFSRNQRQLKRKADLNKSYVRSRSAPKMETIHSRDEIRRDLNRFTEINKYKENTISPEFPPIAGYTGHIPRIKGSEASLSQRYHCAAKRGLELIQIEREKRKELQNADTNIRAIIKPNEKKYSYWNWG